MTPEEVKILSGRLTTKKLIEWCNLKFKSLDIKTYEVFNIYPTRYTSAQYECGACRLVIQFRVKEQADKKDYSGSFYCFFRISELEEYIRSGYELYLHSPGNRFIISDLVLDVRK